MILLEISKGFVSASTPMPSYSYSSSASAHPSAPTSLLIISGLFIVSVAIFIKALISSLIIPVVLIMGCEMSVFDFEPIPLIGESS